VGQAQHGERLVGAARLGRRARAARRAHGVIVDEAHLFSGVLGGELRALLRRMRELESAADVADTPAAASSSAAGTSSATANGSLKKFRVILASATIANPPGFAGELLPRGTTVEVIEAERTERWAM